jgi:hypothetical protein
MTAPAVAQTDDVPPEAVAMFHEAERMCAEIGRKPGTQFYKDCVYNNASMRWARYRYGQIGPVPVAPAPTIAAPRIIVPAPNSGNVYVREAPRTCVVTGNVVTCQ